MPDHLLFAILVACISLVSVLTHKLTVTATIVAALLAIMIYLATGFPGIFLLGTFFLLGISATSFKKQLKEQTGFSETKGTRNTGQVLANGGVAGVLTIAALCLPQYKPLIIFLIACSFSSAAADTVSSEIGFIYGKRCYNIISFKPGPKGENGIVSLEGTLAGIAASIIISAVFAMAVGFNLSASLMIIIAGTAGNLTDSLLGSTLERKRIIGNNTVNFLNTFIAAITGWILYEITM
jgi:uncharacterized protein (TIGR00297 family)